MRLERPVLVEHVKAEAARRIDTRYPLWRQLNIQRAGGSAAMDAFIDGVRLASDALEAMSPIPPDYQQDYHWPESV